MRKLILLAILLGTIVACNKQDAVEKEIAKIPITISIDRFDKKFSEVNETNLVALKEAFPYLFPKQYPDSLWLAKTKDTLQQSLHREINKVFTSTDGLKDDLKMLFQHAKYYFPDTQTPQVVTITSDVDYQQRVLLADSLLFIKLDTYLGSDHKFYNGIQQFHSKNMNANFIVSDVAAILAQQKVAFNREQTLLSKMIYHGKQLYVKQLLIPFKEAHDVIGYTEDEFTWSQANQAQIWRYFVERELLFSTDKKLEARFINPAPFSKFYLELDNESPGMLGKYIGWQIVTSYMDNNKVTLEQMLQTDAETIFNKANYKPKK